MLSEELLLPVVARQIAASKKNTFFLLSKSQIPATYIIMSPQDEPLLQWMASQTFAVIIFLISHYDALVSLCIMLIFKR